MLGDYMGPRIRTGRCNTCAHHLFSFDEMGEPMCYCDLEENQKQGWFPGMHLDYCIFPPVKHGDVCPGYEPCQELLDYEERSPIAPSQRLRLFISRGEIKEVVGRLAGQIRRDYQDKNPLLVCILKGAFVFMADLVRALNMPLEIDFVRLSSYGAAKESSGEVRVVNEPGIPIEGRDVLIIEDIVDTGLSQSTLFDYLMKGNPSSIRLCALLSKPSRRRVEVTIDYLGIEVPDEFLVGYGLDLAEGFRYLPDICILEG